MMESQTLLIRLDGPMQAWGTDSRFGVRDSRREPSKSGVIGLIAAALGRPRSAPIDDLVKLHFGVRVDREGQLLRDFHTAGKDGFYRASGSVERKNVIVSDRFYLADACFTVGLEAHQTDQRELLRAVQIALRRPHWPLFLGRRAFPLTWPPALEIVTAPLLKALQAAPLPEPDRRGRNRYDEGPMRFVLDASAAYGPHIRRNFAGADVPISFSSRDRRYGNRETVTIRISPSKFSDIG